jgi:hypothetical protein
MKPSERIGPLTDFDIGPARVGGFRHKAPVPRPSMVKLRNRETGAVTSHYIVDAREILRSEDTLYERLPGETYPASLSPPEPPEAA